jgi:hypothetical protein
MNSDSAKKPANCWFGWVVSQRGIGWLAVLSGATDGDAARRSALLPGDRATMGMKAPG